MNSQFFNVRDLVVVEIYKRVFLGYIILLKRFELSIGPVMYVLDIRTMEIVCCLPMYTNKLEPSKERIHLFDLVQGRFDGRSFLGQITGISFAGEDTVSNLLYHIEDIETKKVIKCHPMFVHHKLVPVAKKLIAKNLKPS